MRSIELLAPARNADIGIEAIRHGADAVYIGAKSFGARAAAGNSVEDIARLVSFAHFYGARVYVTINTILDDRELEEATALIHQLYEVGVDALIVQDMGLLKQNLPPIPLHASTQMDNRSAEKVKFLRSVGFRQVVLARELSLDEISRIHSTCPDVKLEVFVHGALCVSYSGQCYVSEACFGRSANRGECAQVCRMEFDLEDEDGRKILRCKHLLSLKDICQIDVLEDLLRAGATSFKIEGRLKDVDYVKNVTAAYSQALDEIVKRHPGRYERSSAGRVRLSFTPDVRKSFNRGFTHYFLNGRQPDIFSFDTPKALGEEVGRVKDVFTNHFTIAGVKSFSNGDGLCFIDSEGKLRGFRINRVDNGRLYPLEMPRGLRSKMKVYRNYDHKFNQLLQQNSAERLISVDVDVYETEEGFRLEMSDDYGRKVEVCVAANKELAHTPQTENVKRQLSRLGGTGFELRECRLKYRNNWFIPSSLLGEWRRMLVAEMRLLPLITVSGLDERNDSGFTDTSDAIGVDASLTYLSNVMNSSAAEFYKELGAVSVDPAFEQEHRKDVPVMFCRHCIRYSLGLCSKSEGGRRGDYRGGRLFLRLSNGKRFRLEFDCSECMMKVYVVE